MKVYTYYMPVPGLWPEHTQWDLLNIWHRSWKRAGWEPTVLDENTLKDIPNFAEIKAKIWALPTEYGHDYEGACFLRWLAVAHAGGGLMTDYDAINYTFAPCEPDPNQMNIICEPEPSPVALGVVHGTQEHFQKMFDIFVNWEPHPIHDFNPNAKPQPMLHVSDLSILWRMMVNKNYPKPEWLGRRPGCVGWGHPLWEHAPIVHYGYEMKAAGRWPKCDWVERERPFMTLPFAAGFPYKK